MACSLPASRDLITLVVALETLSLPTFALVGLRRDDGRASEAALKFFLVSVVSTAVTLFGISAGLRRHRLGPPRPASRRSCIDPGAAVRRSRPSACVLALVGFGFKVAAVPFHAWAPDVYVGAPIAGRRVPVGRVEGGGLRRSRPARHASASRPYADTWAPVLAVLAALTMTVGNLVALRQRTRSGCWPGPRSRSPATCWCRSVRPPAATRRASCRRPSPMSLAYAAMNLGAFAVVAAVGRTHAGQRLEDYRGLARRSPVAAGALALALVALAGLPPGLVGLFAKVVVFARSQSGPGPGGSPS